MRAPRLFDAIIDTPWAITEGALQTILEIVAGEVVDLANVAAWKRTSIEAVEAEMGQPMDDARTITVRDGVATILVQGPIVRYADFFSEMSGATSIDTLARDFRRAVSEASVHAIVLLIDSPGGAVNGTNEFAEMVYAAREVKPVVAYVAHLGASAAYWIASACSEVVCDATAALGSIGVVMAMRDPSKQSARDLEFVSSQSPNKRPNPTTERGRVQIQAMVDATADVFVHTVARNRGVTPETVVTRFGQGGLLVGRQAVDAGLADRLGSYEGVLAELQQRKQGTPRMGAQDTAKETSMGLKEVWKGFFQAAKEEGLITTDEPAVEHVTSVAGELLVALPAVDPAQAEAITRLQAEVASLQQEKARMASEARNTRFEALIAGEGQGARWFGDAAAHQAILGMLADAHGEESTAFEAYVTQQRAIAAQLAASPLLQEHGSDASSTTASAWEQIAAKARALVTQDNKLTFEAAVARIAQQDRDLYARYEAERR
jgi:signal peptide peptidase SppA